MDLIERARHNSARERSRHTPDELFGSRPPHTHTARCACPAPRHAAPRRFRAEELADILNNARPGHATRKPGFISSVALFAAYFAAAVVF